MLQLSNRAVHLKDSERGGSLYAIRFDVQDLGGLGFCSCFRVGALLPAARLIYKAPLSLQVLNQKKPTLSRFLIWKFLIGALKPVGLLRSRQTLTPQAPNHIFRKLPRPSAIDSKPYNPRWNTSSGLWSWVAVLGKRG